MDKIEVDTLVIKDKGIVIKDVNKIDENYFISIKDADRIVPDRLDEDYIDGVITLSIRDEVVMDLTFWDDIQSLWHYFINAFEKVISTGEAAFSFPNQPLPVVFKMKNRERLVLTIEDQKYNIDAHTFLEVMCDEAALFFNTLKKLFPRLHLEYELVINRINAIKAKL